MQCFSIGSCNGRAYPRCNLQYDAESYDQSIKRKDINDSHSEYEIVQGRYGLTRTGSEKLGKYKRQMRQAKPWPRKRIHGTGRAVGAGIISFFDTGDPAQRNSYSGAVLGIRISVLSSTVHT